MGFLPGDIAAKVDPYLRPLFDALADMMDAEKVQAALTALGEQTALAVRLAGPGGHSLNFRMPTHAARRNEVSVGAEVTLSALAGGIHLMRPESKTETKSATKPESNA